MQGAFIQALTYRPPTVLGRQLMFFSSWHGLLLEAAASSFIVGGAPGTEDLIFGVWICSHSFADGYAIAADARAIKAWGKSCNSLNFAAAMLAFTDYIAASFTLPKYWSDSSGDGCKAPYFWHAATFARVKLHLTEQQAWDYPLARTSCHQACIAEINGNKDLMSADDIKGMAVLKADVDVEQSAVAPKSKIRNPKSEIK